VGSARGCAQADAHVAHLALRRSSSVAKPSRHASIVVFRKCSGAWSVSGV